MNNLYTLFTTAALFAIMAGPILSRSRPLMQKSFLVPPILTRPKKHNLPSLGAFCTNATTLWSPQISTFPQTQKKQNLRVYSARKLTLQYPLYVNNRCYTNRQSQPAQYEELHSSRDSSTVLVSSCDEQKRIKVKWEVADGEEHSQDFPYVWLRDVCRCSSCFNPLVHSRVCDFIDIDPEVYPLQLKTNEQLNDHVVSIEWSDGHKSEYSVNWLKQFKFQASEEDNTFDPNVRYWGADVGETQLKFFEFADLLESDRALHDWLVEIQELGITVVRNAPQEPGQLHKIGERVAFLRPCNYG